MRYVNLTPHKICMNDGRIFEPSGTVSRVSVTFTEPIDDICRQQFGEVEGLPEPEGGTTYIVSAMVLAATTREDVVAPATGHRDCIRNDNGHIVSVPCFVR